MTWVEQDTKLINGDVCMRCGHCCKVTLNVAKYPNEKASKRSIEYLDTLLGDVNRISFIEIHGPDSVQVKVKRLCPHLDTSKKGFKTCSIYEDRPQTCRTFNCIEAANRSKRAPENWKNIKELIKKYPTKGVDLIE